MDDQLYFRQLLSGRDFGEGNDFATQMRNHCYCVGDAQSREAVLVDPTYDVQALLDQLNEDQMELVGIVLTHYHADHAGGAIAGNEIEGTAKLLSLVDVPVHVQNDEIEFLRKAAELGADELVGHGSADVVTVGDVNIELVHTPGHTPGSQCLLVGNQLLSGDTLFLDGCGRTDLPGGDPIELYYSLTQRLARVPNEVELYPGHHYSNEFSASLGTVRDTNQVFVPKSSSEWRSTFG